MNPPVTPLPLTPAPPLPGVRRIDPLSLHVDDKDDPHRTLDGLVGLGVLTGNRKDGYAVGLSGKADLGPDGKVPASQLPEVHAGVSDVTVDGVSVVSGGTAAVDLSGKVDKVQGKCLSSNDYTTEEKTKLANVEAGAQKNVGVEYTSAEKQKLSGVEANAQKNVAPVAPSTAASAAGKPADAKATGDALVTGFTDWTFTGVPEGAALTLRWGTHGLWTYAIVYPGGATDAGVLYDYDSEDVEEIRIEKPGLDVVATRVKVRPTKTSELENDSGFLTSHQDISGKADKSEMSVTPGTGADADKTTVQLKSGVSATVLTAHQSLSGYATTEELGGKLNSGAAAPDFSSSSTYFVGDYVTYNGDLYRCSAAVTTAGAWTGSANWTKVDMTSPDATVDITSAGALRVVAADGSVLWAEGYGLSTASSSTLSNWSVNRYGFAQDSTEQVALSLPSVSSGRVGDFIVDVSNPSIGVDFSTSDTYAVGDRVFHDGSLYSCSTAVGTAGAWDASNWTLVTAAFDSTATYTVDTLVVYDKAIWKCATAVETAGAWTGTANWQTASFTIAQLTSEAISVVVPSGENLEDTFTFAPGTLCELYFTQTAFQIDSKPTWKVVRQDVEDGGAS